MDFFRERMRLSATLRVLEFRERGRFWRRSFSIAWVLAVAVPWAMDSNWSHSSRRARKRFISRDRSIWHLMHTPVGRCLRNTQFDVLLIFCPPAPDPRINFSNKSASTIPSAVIRAAKAVIFSELSGFSTAGDYWN